MDQPSLILDAAAQETLLDQAIVRVDAETYQAFVDRLDAPPAPNEKLRRTMQTEWPSIVRSA